jgi:hypothetical protein
MIVLRPFVFRDPRVDALLALAAESVPGCEIVPVPTPVDQNTAYHDLVASWWDLCPPDQDLVIVEQDVLVSPLVLAEFDQCPELWCGFPNNAAGAMLVTTGCVRFSAKLREQAPDALAMSRRIGVAQDGTEAGHWERIDVRIFGVLRGMGFVAHEHQPPVVHSRDAQTLRMRQMHGRTE